jgi:hypothetical protein
MPPVAVALEVAAKRTFAVALDWPGWTRAGKEPDVALEALRAAGPRYARVLKGVRLGFAPPEGIDGFRVVERLRGNATTDFGAPGALAKADRRPLDDAEIRRLRSILRACWKAFDAVVSGAEGAHLRKGPRGGGRRTLDAIVEHLNAADGAYLSSVAVKPPMDAALDQTRATIVEVLAAAGAGALPRTRPRGGPVWPPRYFVRRVAWHVLDHAWEIEDRLN